jgi:GcrA cell cycle regulator
MAAWPEEDNDVLKELLNRGWSASQIGRYFGRSRNSVIGRIFRLGLRDDYAKVETKSHWRKPAGVRRARGSSLPQELPAREERVESALDAQLLPLVLPEIPQDKIEAFLFLDPTHCRWPIGAPEDADFRFCCRRRERLSPYCDYHTRLAFRPNHARSWD